MTRVDEFDTFYNSTRRHMLHLTYALCGDRATAGAVVADAYRHAWQQWPKLRGRDSLEYLRNEAWRLTVFERGKHPWRRRHEEDSDLSLLTALQRLSPSARRLIVLQSLGEVGLGSAARDVGMTSDAALELTRSGISSLEQSMATDLADIEERLRRLARVSDRISVPRPHGLRSEARRRTRRNTIASVVVAAAAVVGAGLVATDTGPMNHATAAADREQLGAESAATVPASTHVGTGDLLDTERISRLHRARTWSVTGTDTDASTSEPYTICAPRRFSDPKAGETMVRSFAASGGKDERAVEAVEVSRTPQAANRAYKRMVRWYSNCAMPRVQLIDSYNVERPDGDTRIFRLRQWEHPERTVTVGVSRTGAVTSALVHSIDGTKDSGVKDFAATVRESLAAVCTDADGQCPGSNSVDATLPAPASRAPAFLSVVDLPPVANIDEVWAGTDTMKATPNPAATLCDKSKFTGKNVRKARSRVFVIPEEKRLPEEFGISETVGRFKSVKSAKKFTRTVGDKIDSCEKDNLSASIGDSSKVSGTVGSGAPVKGSTWKIAFEIDKKSKVHYRVAVVRKGRDVAQISFSPTKKFDVTSKSFDHLARRSGERLAYLD